MESGNRIQRFKKNKIQIEEFAGRRKTIIKQDPYAKIFIYNIAIAIKRNGNIQIKRNKKQQTKNQLYTTQQ